MEISAENCQNTTREGGADILYQPRRHQVLLRMKLYVLCLVCFAHLALVHCGLSSQTGRSSASSRGSGSSTQGRVRPLFARRGQFERQRIHVPKPKVAPVPPNHIPSPVKPAVHSAKPGCSQLANTCLPLSGCCDSNASCHCRFFNAICYCRKLKSQHDSKQNSSTSKLGQKYANATGQ